MLVFHIPPYLHLFLLQRRLFKLCPILHFVVQWLGHCNVDFSLTFPFEGAFLKVNLVEHINFIWIEKQYFFLVHLVVWVFEWLDINYTFVITFPIEIEGLLLIVLLLFFHSYVRILGELHAIGCDSEHVLVNHNNFIEALFAKRSVHFFVQLHVQMDVVNALSPVHNRSKLWEGLTNGEHPLFELEYCVILIALHFIDYTSHNDFCVNVSVRVVLVKHVVWCFEKVLLKHQLKTFTTEFESICMGLHYYQ